MILVSPAGALSIIRFMTSREVARRRSLRLRPLYGVPALNRVRELYDLLTRWRSGLQIPRMTAVVRSCVAASWVSAIHRAVEVDRPLAGWLSN